MNNNKLSTFLKGLIAENPVLVLVLGTCPTLAQTKSFINALSMGLAATVVLICSNIVISALRKVIPNTVRIPCYIVVIAGFVTVVQLVMHAYLPAFYEMMGVYLALIVVNCIILGRAEMFARKNPVLDSVIDGVGMGLGFLLALFAIATVREVFGAGSFFGLAIPFLENYKIPILVQAPGGFFVYGIMIAVMNCITAKSGGVKRKSFSCEGCPSSAICDKSACAQSCTSTKDIENADVKEDAENA